MTYSFDSFGWYTSTAIAGRTTDKIPQNTSETTTPGALRSNYTGYEWVELPYVTPVYTPPPRVIPEAVTRRQARQALVLAGKFDLVQVAFDAIPDPLQRQLMQIEWDDSLDFERNRSSLMAIGAAIGLTSADIDDLFITAKTL